RLRPRGRLLRVAGRALPEAVASYPTYRWHVTKGKVSSTDDAVRTQVTDALAALARDHDVVVGPMGIGGHVDHVLCAGILTELSRDVPTVAYADQPYFSQLPEA